MVDVLVQTDLCALAHRYQCAELERATFQCAKSFAKKVKLSETTPTTPELLLLGQNIQNRALLDAVLQEGMHVFCAIPAGLVAAAPTQCPLLLRCTEPSLPKVMDAVCGRCLSSSTPKL